MALPERNAVTHKANVAPSISKGVAKKKTWPQAESSSVALQETSLAIAWHGYTMQSP